MVGPVLVVPMSSRGQAAYTGGPSRLRRTGRTLVLATLLWVLVREGPCQRLAGQRFPSQGFVVLPC